MARPAPHFRLRSAAIAAVVLASSVACIGEMSSLSGSPCDSDLDCPGMYTCATLSLDGRRSCQPLTAEPPPAQVAPPPPEGTPYFCDEVKPVVDQYCNSCHGSNRTPSGVQHMRFDQWVDDEGGVKGAKSSATRIRVRMADFKDMPPSTSPQPTDDQRELIRRWEHAGAPNCQDNPFPPWNEQSAATLDAGTGAADAGMTADAGTTPVTLSYAQHVQPIWDLYCTGCHTAGNARGGLDLSAAASFNELVNRPSACNSQVDLVNPNDPQGSMLFLKVVGDPARCLSVMPTGAALHTFDADATAVIQQWIQAGAPNN